MKQILLVTLRGNRTKDKLNEVKFKFCNNECIPVVFLISNHGFFTSKNLLVSLYSSTFVFSFRHL